MAVYEYTCSGCGAFDVTRPMGTAATEETCPVCGDRAPRAFSAPALTAPRSPRRQAQEAADRSAHKPNVTAAPDPRPSRRARQPNPLHARFPKP